MSKFKSGPKIVVIGGGTGSFTVLSGLKNHTNNLSAIVNMSDDGGSTGILRDELGVLPPGDIRQCLVALSRKDELLRELFNYRFSKGTFKGHNFGNLFLTALEKITGSFEKAVVQAGEVLDIMGSVIPVTTKNTHLCVELSNKKVVCGQQKVDETKILGKNPRFFLKPRVKINPLAEKELKKADLIILGPGNIYSSLVPNLLVEGVVRSINNSKAKKIYICNLTTKPGQTEGFLVHDFVSEIEKYLGPKTIDFVIFNNNKPPKYLIEKYASKNEEPVWYEINKLRRKNYKCIGEDLIGKIVFKQNKGDFLKRTLIRHNPEVLAKLIMQIHYR